MKNILVGYDLNQPMQNYEGLIKQLKAGYSTWWHNLDSTWIIRTAKSPVQVRDELLPYLDANDEILVIDITGGAAAWNGFSATGSLWLKNHL